MHAKSYPWTVDGETEYISEKVGHDLGALTGRSAEHVFSRN
jgi:hypothetical protein